MTTQMSASVVSMSVSPDKNAQPRSRGLDRPSRLGVRTWVRTGQCPPGWTGAPVGTRRPARESITLHCFCATQQVNLANG